MIVSVSLLFLALSGVLASGFFSGAETGAYCVNPVRLRLRCDAGDLAARRLRRLLDDQPAILSTALIGTNLSNYLATASLTLWIARYAIQLTDSEVEIYTTLILMPIIFVFGEVVPKNWFRQQADRLMDRCSMLLLISQKIFSAVGAVPVLGWLSMRLLKWWHGSAEFEQVLHPRREMAVLLREGVAEGIMTDQQSKLVDGVLKLSSVRIGSIMIPFSRVIALPEHARRKEIEDTMRGHGFSRYPVVKGHSRRILGVVNIYDYMADPRADDIHPFITQPLKVSPGDSVFATLYRMRDARQTIGVVVDRWDNCIGMVTVKDLVEEVVGELHAW